MTPIISPWVFYLIGLSTPLKAVFGILGGISLFVICLKWIDDVTDRYKPDKLAVFIASVSILLCLFVPNESTITKMVIAQNVTYERVEMVGDTVEDVYNDIISLVDKGNDTEE